MESDRDKIFFRFYSNIYDEEMVEVVWAAVVDREKGIFRIDNIPFYIPSIASGDLVYAEFDDLEQTLTYRETLEYSGKSVVQVVIMDKEIVTNHIREIFKNLGCESEKAKEGYFSMEIPKDLNYKSVNDKLKELANEGYIDYAEPCLSDIHRLQIETD